MLDHVLKNFDNFLIKDAQENSEMKPMRRRGKMILCHVASPTELFLEADQKPWLTAIDFPI